MIIPGFIKKGDAVAVTAPSDGNASRTDIARLSFAKEKLESLGINVVETDNVRKSKKGRSGGAMERAEQFMDVWRDERVKCVFSAKGGDFLMEMLPYIDFSEIAKNPKWFQGYSDNTGLSFTITTMCGIATMYASNFNDFAMGRWHRSIKDGWDILCGRDVAQHSFSMYQDGFFSGETGREGYALDKRTRWKNLSGGDSVRMKGRIIGGCLDVLLTLVGTRYDKVREFNEKYSGDGVIWFFESFALGSEDLERGLWQLKQAGWLENARGFIFGRPAFFSSSTETSYKEAVLNELGDLGVPIVLDADIGHKPPRLAIVNGARCVIESGRGKGGITYPYPLS